MRDKTSEPEDHRDGFDGQDRKRMRSSGKESWREREERDNDKGSPDSGEDQEVDAVRGTVDGISVPP